MIERGPNLVRSWYQEIFFLAPVFQEALLEQGELMRGNKAIPQNEIWEETACFEIYHLPILDAAGLDLVA